MNTIDCPACSGPDNAQCSTCNGSSLVDQESYDLFMEKIREQNAEMQLKLALSKLPITNVLGVEQKTIILTTENNIIEATIDKRKMVWNEFTASWV